MATNTLITLSQNDALETTVKKINWNFEQLRKIYRSEVSNPSQQLIDRILEIVVQITGPMQLEIDALENRVDALEDRCDAIEDRLDTIEAWKITATNTLANHEARIQALEH